MLTNLLHNQTWQTSRKTRQGHLSTPQLSHTHPTLPKPWMSSWCWKAVNIRALTRNRKECCAHCWTEGALSHFTPALLLRQLKDQGNVFKLFLCFTKYLSQNLAQRNLLGCLWVCFASKTKTSFINSGNIHGREEADPLDSKAALSVRRCMNTRSRKQVNGSHRGHLYLLEPGADPKPVTQSRDPSPYGNRPSRTN